LLASRSSAQYLQNGRKVEVAPERLFRDMHIRHVEGGGDFEAYPNRDAISYIDIYGLQGIETMYRGTLRNMGWCDTMYSFGRLGLLDLDEIEVRGKSYADLMRELLGAGASDDVEQVIGKKLGIASEALPVRNLQWLGMLSDRRIKGERTTPLDALGELMLEKLAYSEGERDMVVLLHDFEVKYRGGQRAQITSTMVNLGIEKGDSSMSRTVALPAAIASHLIVQGAIKRPGVIRPVTPDIYNPVLDELATLNIDCQEKVESY
jgi:saccharopine dehydrogenase-like NADP-dependent oxidoreductase